MTDWTKEEDEAFNAVEKQSNLGKQILKAQGQPYHWEIDAIQAAIRMEREACAKVCDERAQKKDLSNHRRCDADLLASAIRARGQE
jgi:hypothetical protein